MHKLRIVGLVTLVACCIAAPAKAADGDHSSATKENTKAEGHAIAELNVMKSRATGQRNADDLFLLFGDRLSAPQLCYQAAISNYLDDKWSSTAKSLGCTSNETLCNAPQAEEALSNTLEMSQLNGSPYDRQTAISKTNPWIIAPKLYGLTRAIDSHLDPLSTSKVTSGLSADEEVYATEEFLSYIKSCATREPSTWSIVGTPLPDDGLATIAIKVGVQGLLTAILIDSQLSADNKYSRCIRTLNQMKEKQSTCKDKACADVVPKDNKEALKAQLEELNSQHCTPTYVLEMLAKQHN